MILFLRPRGGLDSRLRQQSETAVRTSNGYSLAALCFAFFS